MAHGVLQASQEGLGVLPEHRLAVALARVTQDHPKHPAPPHPPILAPRSSLPARSPPASPLRAGIPSARPAADALLAAASQIASPTGRNPAKLASARRSWKILCALNPSSSFARITLPRECTGFAAQASRGSKCGTLAPPQTRNPGGRNGTLWLRRRLRAGGRNGGTLWLPHRVYRHTVLRWIPNSRAMRRWDHFFSCKLRICFLVAHFQDVGHAPIQPPSADGQMEPFSPSKVVHFDSTLRGTL